MTPAELFSAGRYQDLADQIDTAGFDPKIVRILTVFNPGPRPASGPVVFLVEMRWRSDRPLPPVHIFDLITHATMPLRIDDLHKTEDRITFALNFYAQSVPASGYKSFVAEYTDVPSPLLTDSADLTECAVVETLPHPGALPWTMSFS